MSRLIVCCLAAALVVFAGSALVAQDKKDPPDVKAADAKDPIHDELRALMAAVKKAVNDKDMDGLLKHLHPNGVVVWQNAEISRGHKGVRDYYQKHLGGPNATLDSFTVEPEAAELSILYGGDTAVSFGKSVSRFKFKSGQTFDLTGPWSATLVKEEGRWQIVSFHASAGLFDNPLVAAATKALYWGCSIAAVVGLLVGAGGMALVRRKRA